MATATEHQQRLRHHLEDAVRILKDAQNALAAQPPDYLQAAVSLDALETAARRANIRAHKIHFGQE